MKKDNETFDGETIYWLENDPGDRTNAHTKRNSVTDGEAAILREQAKGLNVVEIGTGTGFSSLEMVKTAKSVTTVDIDTFVHMSVFPELEENGIRCLDSLIHVVDKQFDMVFIDGEHSPAGVTRDLNWARKATSDGGFIIVHDLHLGSCGPTIRKWADEAGWSVDPFGTTQGLGRLNRQGKWDT